MRKPSLNADLISGSVAPIELHSQDVGRGQHPSQHVFMSVVNDEDRVLAESGQGFGDQVFWSRGFSRQEDQIVHFVGVTNASGKPLLSCILRPGPSKVLGQ